MGCSSRASNWRSRRKRSIESGAARYGERILMAACCSCWPSARCVRARLRPCRRVPAAGWFARRRIAGRRWPRGLQVGGALLRRRRAPGARPRRADPGLPTHFASSSPAPALFIQRTQLRRRSPPSLPISLIRAPECSLSYSQLRAKRKCLSTVASDTPRSSQISGTVQPIR